LHCNHPFVESGSSIGIKYTCNKTYNSDALLPFGKNIYYLKGIQ